MQQKVQVVATLIHEPDLLILDEPFSGLDPVNMRLLRDLILEQHTAGRTVIFSTHVMHQAETTCDHIVMINDGVKVLDSTLQGIRARFDPRAVLVEPMDADEDMRALRSIDRVREVGRADGAWRVGLEDSADPVEVIRAIAAAIPVARVEVQRPTLEDVFVRIVKGEGQDEAELRASVRADREVVA